MNFSNKSTVLILLSLYGFIPTFGLRAETDFTLNPNLIIAKDMPVQVLSRILEIRNSESRERSHAGAEKEYQTLVQAQTLSDLAKIYLPENAHRLQIVYASFTPEGGRRGGGDLGFGLHVVKRLVLEENGVSRTIDVNEAWPEDRTSHGLLLPDEIRIKTQVLDGPRKVEGSDQLYIFDQIRLAWGPSQEVSLHRQTRFYDNQDRVHFSRTKDMRIPVSAPNSCMGCHGPDSGRRGQFLAPGEKVNYEAVVQDSQFRLPVSEMKGFKEYLKYLDSKPNVTDATKKKIISKLIDPKQSMQVPGLLEELGRVVRGRSFNWLIIDMPFGNYNSDRAESEAKLDKQGVYRTREGRVMIESIEDVFEGKYRWWEPQVVIP